MIESKFQSLPVSVKPCPWLPVVNEVLDFTVTRRHGADKGQVFYFDALRYAQSQWMSGKPAQALLQLDKAWMADLPLADASWQSGANPYRALVWMLEETQHADCGYFGNPVRHFQHLASRMCGERSEVRSWRAWLCMHLSERYLPPTGYSRDGFQIAREGLWVPGASAALGALFGCGWSGEAQAVGDLLGI